MTEAEEKLKEITRQLEQLKTKDRLKADVAYTHLASIIKWLIVVILLMFAMLCGSVVWFFNTFDISTETESIDIDAGEGNANYIEGEGNSINNG